MKWISLIALGTLSVLTLYGGSTPPFTTTPLTFAGVPNSVTLGSDGNIWLIDRSANKVGKLTAEGAYTTFSIPTANAIASGITLGPDGNAWFAEFGPSPNKIARVTPDGVITEFALPAGKSLGGVTAGADENVWFTESRSTSNGPVYLLGHISTADGSLSDFALPTTGRAQGLVSGVDGNLWIGWVEFSGTKYDVLRVTPAGTVTSFALPATSALNALGATMLLGPDGNVWFTYQNNLARVTPAGVATLYAIPTANANMLPAGLTIGQDLNIWFTEFSSGKVGQLVLDTATDSGQATINESDSLGGLPQTIFPLPFAPRAAGKIGELGDLNCNDVFLIEIQESSEKPPMLKVAKKPPVIQCADISVHLTRAKAAGANNAVLTATVTNDGPNPAQNVQLKVWIFFSDAGGLTPVTRDHSWPTLTKGQVVAYDMQSVDTDQIFDAVVRSDTLDPNAANNRHRAKRKTGSERLTTVDVKLEDPIAANTRGR